MTEESEVIKILERLQLLKAELKAREAYDDPVFYGLPDLLFPRGHNLGVFNEKSNVIERTLLDYEETEEQYKQRQNKCIADFIPKYLWFEKDGRRINPVMIPGMIDLISDLFYRRVNRVILWANRGGGKSLIAAIVIWMVNVYRKQSFLNVAGSGDQARRVYDYTKKFWHCRPGLSKGMLLKDPLQTLTQKKNGTRIVCIDSSASAIGEHVPGFVSDEVVSGSEKADNNISRAMQGCLSEPNYLVFLLSTFHLPTGLFQKVWDSNEKMGFTRYKWNIYDCMSPCDDGMDTATEHDPQALEYCHSQCPLSRLVETKDKFGKTLGQKWIGCLGKARDSQGWLNKETVVEEMEVNKGTKIFETEHECERPRHQGLIYNPDIISHCLVNSVTLDLESRKTVGIDWGLTECAVSLLVPWIDDITGIRGLTLVAVRYLSNQLVAEVAEQIQAWQEEFGDNIMVRADASHPYANKELRQFGYSVKVVKGDKKRIGETNLMRWLGSGLFRIFREGMGISMFTQQMKNLRRDSKSGKQKKRNVTGVEGDHGPDCVKFATMNYDFITWRSALIADGIINKGDIVENEDGFTVIKGT